MKKVFTCVALLALTLTVASCKSKDDAPQTTPQNETPAQPTAPAFMGKTYAVTYASDDKTEVYRTEITFLATGKISGTITTTNVSGTATSTFAGSYVYNAATGALTFSDLTEDGQAATAEQLYLDRDPRYNAQADSFFLGGSTYELSNKVQELTPEAPAQPETPAQPSQPETPAQPETPSQPSQPAANGAQPFHGKTYVLAWTNGGESYEETWLFSADGSVNYIYKVGGEVSESMSGSYTYDPETHKITFTRLLSNENPEGEDLASLFSVGAVYAPDSDTIHLQNGNYSAR